MIHYTVLNIINKRSKCPLVKAASGNPNNNSTARAKKFCHYCNYSDRKYWTHNTEEYYLKKPARESNAIKALQKEFNKVKSLLKNLKKNKDSDSESELLLQDRHTLNAANKTKINSKRLECESRTQSTDSINRLDRLISKNKNKYK